MIRNEILSACIGLKASRIFIDQAYSMYMQLFSVGTCVQS
jgi:hypothetical protein